MRHPVEYNSMLNITPIPAFKDNYIWAFYNDRHAVVVDPGDAAPVRIWLDQHKLGLSAILCTHHHYDHVGGICELAELYNAPAYGPQNEIIPCVSYPVGEGERIEITEMDIHLEVLGIAGHTRGHIAYVIHGSHGESALFCGDTLFGCGCGRLFEGTAAQLHRSLQRLVRLPDDTQIYCAHEYTEANIRFALACEPTNLQLKQRQEDAHARRAAGQPTLPSTIALEKATNPFLRCTKPEIIHTLHQHGLTDSTELAAFTAMREWKNHF